MNKREILASGAQSPIHQPSCLPEGKTLPATPPLESLPRFLGASQAQPSGGLLPDGVLSSPGLGAVPRQKSRQGAGGAGAGAPQFQFRLYDTRRGVVSQPLFCVHILKDCSCEKMRVFWQLHLFWF